MTDYEAAVRRLKLDLAAFGDPGAEVTVAPQSDGWYRVSWEEDARQREGIFLLDEFGPTHVRLESGDAQAYRTFLAGPDMGNLRALARNTLQVLRPLENFIPPRARSEGDEPQDGDAMDLLLAAALPPADRTAVVFVAADAGVGKTVLLRSTVRQQAARYLEGGAPSLWLYVDAQARRLAALDEALASELDRLRARFSFDAASALVRTGALTLVIDGFDELLGSVGAYDEAFNSLADFIAGLDGGGALVAAARSAYYEQEFLARVGRGLGQGDRWILRPLRLREWRPEQRQAYVLGEATRAGQSSEEAKESVTAVESALAVGELEGVAGKPFFVARTTDLVLDGGLPAQSEPVSLLERLVHAYLERDASKLLSGARTPLLRVEGLRSLFDELAVEMWRQEARELSRSSVKEIATLIGELEGLDDDGVREVTTRAPYFAMLREGSLPGSVAWEHDVYFAYFLSRPLADVILSADAKQLSRLLRRGRLPEEGAMLVGSLTRHVPGQDLLDLLAAAVAAEEIDADRVRRNAGLLAAGWLAGGEHQGLHLHDLRIGDISLGTAVLRECQVHNVHFAGTDLTSTDLVACRASGTNLFDRVVIAPGQTRLDVQGLSVEDFFSLVLRTEEEERTLYSPADIRVALDNCSLPAAAPELTTRSVDPGTLGLLERLCRLYLRTNVVVEGDDNDLTPITSAPEWSSLRKILVETGVVVPRVRSASGHKVFLERAVRAPEIMAGLDPEAAVPVPVRRLWDRLEEQAPAPS